MQPLLGPADDDERLAAVVMRIDHTAERRDAIAAALRSAGASTSHNRRASLRQMHAVGATGGMPLPDSDLALLMSEDGGGRLGTFRGVFVPCTSTIFGVVVFLRLGLVVGQAGAWCTLVIIAAAFAICLLTTLSLCALISDGTDDAQPAATARTSRDPGVYAALRRAVGPEIGAALGVSFHVAYTALTALYVISFASSARKWSNFSSAAQVPPPRPPTLSPHPFENAALDCHRSSRGTRRARGSTCPSGRSRSRSSPASPRAASTCHSTSRAASWG